MKKGIAPVNEFYNTIEKMENNQAQPVTEDSGDNRKSTDSI